jgi:predicted nucleic acid-binding protein
MFLLDTVVLSELRKSSSRQSPLVMAWIRNQRAVDVFVSVITISEIERGVEAQRARNPIFAKELALWIETVLRVYHDRILPISTPIARCWGRLAYRIGHAGHDLAIAATALEHGLTVATRNVSDFAPTGAAIFNPFEEIPQ